MAHKAIVAQITEVMAIPGADRIHVARVLGENVIVSKEWGVGHIGILFPVGVCLSEEYCRENNLFRHAHLNRDNTKTGFFEDEGRVRAQPFLKVKSEGYFTSLDSMAYLNHSENMTLGFQFDHLNGKKICEKWMNKETLAKLARVGNQPKKKKATTPFFAKHVDSDQFKHFASAIPVGSLLSFHAKVHGTSARMAYTKVEKELTGFQKFVNKFASVFPESVYDYVVGTRNVVITDSAKEGFHGSEQFRYDAFEQVKPYLTRGMTVYGEIAGYANDQLIMPTHDVRVLKDKKYTEKYGTHSSYTYGCGFTKQRFHIYRISYTTDDGVQIDMTQKQMEQWCKDRNLLTTFEVHPQMVYDGDLEALRTLVDQLTERPDVLTEDYIDPTHISEGVIIRVDHGTLVPKFYKSKSYAFRAMEGLCEAVDPEDAA